VRYGALFVALTLLAPPAAAEDAVERQTEVGPVQATLRLTPAQPVIGDPLTLEIEVRAEPGVEVLMPEFGEALDRFAIVDFVPSETVDDEGRTIARQRYRLQPSRSGSQRIPPILVEFVDRRPGQTPAPEGADAHELLTERLEFEVTSVLPEDAALELRPARGELPPLEASGPRVWAFVVVGLALLAALSPWLVRFWLAYRARARQRSAFDLAYAELEALLAGPRPAPDVPAAMDRFFVKLSGIVRRYLEPALTGAHHRGIPGGDDQVSRSLGSASGLVADLPASCRPGEVRTPRTRAGRGRGFDWGSTTFPRREPG
jgi:hypothetical protein